MIPDRASPAGPDIAGNREADERKKGSGSMGLSVYQDRIVMIRDHWNHTFTGTADVFPPDYGMHVYNREEEGVRIGDFMIFEGDIEEIRERTDFAVIRATETWQQAGAYYVRIQAMARKHHIPLRQEFDDHDGPDTKYIVVTDKGFPIATARMYPLEGSSMMIGRVVVLPEYRHQGIGSMVVTECECWADELGFGKTVVESRDNKTGFYEWLGYEIAGEPVDGDTFRCVRMEKSL